MLSFVHVLNHRAREQNEALAPVVVGIAPASFVPPRNPNVTLLSFPPPPNT